MDIRTFLSSTASIIAALGALVAATASLIKAIADVRKRRKKPSKSPSIIVILLKTPFFDIGILLMVVAIGIFVGRDLLPPLPLNAQLTCDAWEALGKADYATTIDKARECIDNFESGAIREQESLIASGSPPPPTGAVSSSEKKVILSRGILNDVATCYYIMGLALEELGRVEEAKDAYRGAQQFPYARTWDPQGWFWSPADAAGDRLAQLP